MKRFALMVAVVGLLGLSPLPLVSRALAGTETQVTAAASGTFPPGATFNGVPLQGSTFGFGVVVRADGSAVGIFEIVLAGTSLLGQAQDITLVGNVSSGLSNLDGSVTFSGTGRLDLGDGSLPTDGVPFAVTATTNGLQVTIGATILPTQTLADGSIFIGG